ncbi:hypothetical protein GALL_290100 [mine drainage metagenome]|uniref:Pel9A-like right handed beta-helix region domain-containing protein n=1 Tax=mine drainage metagenome TaxID=410659 RepID=A0A1J5QZG1_9ZZZZ
MKLKILSFGVLALFGACRCAARAYFVSPSGRDRNPGTLTQPFRTLQRAQQELRHPGGTVYLRGGVYYLPKTLVFTAQDSGTKDRPVVFEAYGNEQPVISGGVRLTGLQWRPFKNGIMQATVPTDLKSIQWGHDLTLDNDAWAGRR